MNGTNGNEPGYPENALVPYPVIVVATKGGRPSLRCGGRRGLSWCDGDGGRFRLRFRKRWLR